MSQHSFHLAFHVTDLASTRDFYGRVLGCLEGRSTDTWVDFDFFGHQISCHLGEPFATTNTGLVAGLKVPMPHLGVVLDLATWQTVNARLEAETNTDYVFAKMLRYEGEPGEQWTVFVRDPSGNPIEIKGFKDMAGVYAV